MTTKPAIYAGLIACATLILIKGANGNLLEGVILGVFALLGTVIYARTIGRGLD